MSDQDIDPAFFVRVQDAIKHHLTALFVGTGKPIYRVASALSVLRGACWANTIENNAEYLQAANACSLRNSEAGTELSYLKVTDGRRELTYAMAFEEGIFVHYTSLGYCFSILFPLDTSEPSKVRFMKGDNFLTITSPKQWVEVSHGEMFTEEVIQAVPEMYRSESIVRTEPEPAPFQPAPNL